MTPDERADLDAELDQVVRATSRLAAIAIVLSVIGISTGIWAEITDGAPLLVQLLGVPIGTVIGYGLKAAAFAYVLPGKP